MIPLDKEMAFVSWYVVEKEYNLTKTVRYALNKIHYFNTKKGEDISLAIHIVNKMIMAKEGIDLPKEYLWKMYQKRKAHIKNGKAKFKTYDIEQRRSRGPNKEPLPVCECGCGTILKPGRRFAHGHNARCRDDDDNKKRAKNMRSVKNAKKQGKVIPLF